MVIRVGLELCLSCSRRCACLRDLRFASSVAGPRLPLSVCQPVRQPAAGRRRCAPFATANDTAVEQSGGVAAGLSRRAALAGAAAAATVLPPDRSCTSLQARGPTA